MTVIETEGKWLLIKARSGQRAVIRIDSIIGYAPVYDGNTIALRIAYGSTHYDIFYDNVTYQEQLRTVELMDGHIKQLDTILGIE